MKIINLSDLNQAYRLSESKYARTLGSGTYYACILSAEISYSNDNNRQIEWHLETTFSPLTKKSMPYLQKELEILGIFINDLNELHEILPGLIGSIIEIEVDDDPIENYYRVDFLRKIL
ncbi:MAG: hypothetical protein NTU97_02175 [Candidatus Magasanikbacteria bacterium]|nr:hypothetical protein [Candidatus Magasanikbacteria bacterium]